MLGYSGHLFLLLAYNLFIKSDVFTEEWAEGYRT